MALDIQMTATELKAAETVNLDAVSAKIELQNNTLTVSDISAQWNNETTLTGNLSFREAVREGGSAALGFDADVNYFNYGPKAKKLWGESVPLFVREDRPFQPWYEHRSSCANEPSRSWKPSSAKFPASCPCKGNATASAAA